MEHKKPKKYEKTLNITTVKKRRPSRSLTAPSNSQKDISVCHSPLSAYSFTFESIVDKSPEPLIFEKPDHPVSFYKATHSLPKLPTWETPDPTQPRI